MLAGMYKLNAAPIPIPNINKEQIDWVIRLLKLVQVLQSCQDHLLARLFNFPRQKDLVQYCVHLVKVKDQIELADVAEEGVQDLDEEVYHLEIGELVVVCVDARAEEEARVPAVDDLAAAELDEVGLILLVTGRNEAVDLAQELDLLVVAEGVVPLRQAGFAPGR